MCMNNVWEISTWLEKKNIAIKNIIYIYKEKRERESERIRRPFGRQFKNTYDKQIYCRIRVRV